MHLNTCNHDYSEVDDCSSSGSNGRWEEFDLPKTVAELPAAVANARQMLSTQTDVKGEARVAFLHRILSFLDRKCLHGFFWSSKIGKAETIPGKLKAEITTSIADTRVALAEVLTSQRLFRRAKSQCRKALEAVPKHPEAKAALERVEVAEKAKPSPRIEPRADPPEPSSVALPTVSAFSTAFEAAEGGAQ